MKTVLLILLLVLASGNPAGLLKDSGQAATLRTFRSVGDGELHILDYRADYHLQDFIDADLNSQAAVREHVAKTLLRHPSSIELQPAVPACSAFQAVTPDGDVIYGRNFDYRFKDGATILMRTRPRRGYKSLSMVSMNFVGYEGSQLTDGKTDLSMLVAAPLMQMDGMNEKGLAMSVLAVMADECAQQYDEGKHTVMTSVMMRMVLDRCATVDEVLAMLSGYNFFCDGLQTDRKRGDKSNYHFLVSDASGHTVVLEYVKPEGPGSDCAWVMNTVDEKFTTNHFRSECFRHLEKPDDRWKTLDATLREKDGVLTEEEAMALLDAVHQTASPKHESRTQWSVVYNLTKRTATICMDGRYDKKYSFSLNRFK